jgi:hypothetical protein
VLHTFETRLDVGQEASVLLTANAAHWSWGLRKAWSLLYRKHLSKVQAYAALTKCDFSSEQVGSLLIAAEMRHAGLVELKKYEQGQLELAIAKRERAIRDKQKKIATLEKQQEKLRAKREKLEPKPGKPRSKKYREVLAKLREIPSELRFCRNWVAQKERVLKAKRGLLQVLVADIEAGRYSLCFGSKKLLAQRPTAYNRDTTPFTTLDDWRKAWDVARSGQWWSVGKTYKPQGNAEVQWLPETKQLRLRLTDKVAHSRMDARGVPRAGGKQSDMPKRMQCRFLVLDNVDFISHKGLSSAALKGASGRLPVTMRILSRLQDDGTVAWYVQASVEVPTGFAPETARSREGGVMGLDLNARGVAWSVVKPDGNQRVVDGKPQRGFVSWDLKVLSDASRKQVVGTVVLELAEKAQQLGVAVAVENLDFATKKLTMRAGAVSKRYNEMLSSLASSQFAEMVVRACEKRRVKLYRVNPSYSSLGGYAKYGRLNRCNADEAAALWLGRQALLGTVWKTEGALNYVKKQDERLVFPHLPATRMQSMKALAGVQWKDVARGLGKNRQLWGAKLRTWFLCQVEAASQPAQGEPSMAMSPPEMKRGFQPGSTSAPGDAAEAALVATC